MAKKKADLASLRSVLRTIERHRHWAGFVYMLGKRDIRHLNAKVLLVDTYEVTVETDRGLDLLRYRDLLRVQARGSYDGWERSPEAPKFTGKLARKPADTYFERRNAYLKSLGESIEKIERRKPL